jgi:hypothetical protein
MTIQQLIIHWVTEAQRHEDKIDELHEFDEIEERALHTEIARIYRKCANELRALTAHKETTNA